MSQSQGHMVNERYVVLSFGQRQEARGWLADIGISTKGDSMKRVLHMVDNLYDGGIECFIADTNVL